MQNSNLEEKKKKANANNVTAPVKTIGSTEELALLHPTLSDYSAPPQHTPPGKAVAKGGIFQNRRHPSNKNDVFLPLEEQGRVLSLASVVVLFSKDQLGSGRLLQARADPWRHSPAAARCARGTVRGERRWSLRSELPRYLLSALGVNRS